MFPPLSYLEWIVGRPGRATHDLGSSDLRPVDPGDGVIPAALHDLPDPEASLEELLADEYGVGPENVLVTAGATHANFLVAAAALGRCDADEPDVLVEKPGYEPLVETPAGLGARVTRFVRPAGREYELDPDRAEAAMTEETALVTATNHHNPSGRITDREAISGLNRVAAEADAMLLVDEVYSPLGDGGADAPLGGVSGARLSNTVVTNSLTKFYGLGDVRIGWLVADESFVERARSVKWHVPAVSGPSRRLAARALANADVLDRRSRDLAAENHALLAEFVEDRDDLSGFVSPGCTFAFPAHERTDGGERERRERDPRRGAERTDGDAVAEAAWKAGVLVVPGRFFDDDARFRLSVGRRTDAVRAGLDAFGDVLDDL